MLNTLLPELLNHLKTNPQLNKKINLAKKELLNLFNKDRDYLEKEKHYLKQSMLMKNWRISTSEEVRYEVVKLLLHYK